MSAHDKMKLKLLDDLESEMDNHDSMSYANKKTGMAMPTEGSAEEEAGESPAFEKKEDAAMSMGKSSNGGAKTEMLQKKAAPPHLTHPNDPILMRGQFA